jgi:hypothetical protein
MPAYLEKFPVGTSVRVRSRFALEEFAQSWKFHHPLTAAQLEYADKKAEVAAVGFYHGGDPLYTFLELPGLWHEQCLEAAID